MPPPAVPASTPLAPAPAPRRRAPVRGRRSDEALARRAGEGDDDAFAVLYGRYAPRLEAYCRSIVRHEEDARDAVQTTMTKALVALRRRDREIVVRPWLFRIAHNEAVTVLRRRRPVAELSDLVADAGLDPHGRAVLREEIGATLDCIRALPDRLAHPLLLREVSGLSYDEVGAVLGEPPEAARKAVFEARSALAIDRAALAEDCSAIRATLSDGDGRRRRARRVRSHLRACRACSAWDTAQRERRRRLAALPFGAVPAGGSVWAWVTGALGVGASASGGGATLLSGAMGASVKAAAAVAVIAAGAGSAVGEDGVREAGSGSGSARVVRGAPAAAAPAQGSAAARGVGELHGGAAAATARPRARATRAAELAGGDRAGAGAGGGATRAARRAGADRAARGAGAGAADRRGAGMPNAPAPAASVASAHASATGAGHDASAAGVVEPSAPAAGSLVRPLPGPRAPADRRGEEEGAIARGRPPAIGSRAALAATVRRTAAG